MIGRNVELILENCKFIWEKEQIDLFIKLYNQNIRPTKIAKLMNEEEIDITLLGLHLFQEGKIGKQQLQERARTAKSNKK